MKHLNTGNQYAQTNLGFHQYKRLIRKIILSLETGASLSLSIWDKIGVSRSSGLMCRKAKRNVRLVIRRSRVRSPPESATFFRGDWSRTIFSGHSLPSADSRRAVSFWHKNVHKFWLPRNGQVNWPAQHDLNSVDWAVKLQTKQQQMCNFTLVFVVSAWHEPIPFIWGTVFPARLYVRPAKTQISMRIRAVWSEPSYDTLSKGNRIYYSFGTERLKEK